MAESGRDLVLAPNEYCYVISETTGNVTLYVGPSKTALGQQDQAAVFNSDTKRFERKAMDKAIQLFTSAPEGWYVSLKNPAQDNSVPRIGTANNMAPLAIGSKVNIVGPCSYALWPGQIAKSIKGHFLRSDEYLLVRVYNEKAARANWDSKILKYRVQSLDQAEKRESEFVAQLTEGSVFIIPGDLFTFFIPPTGIDVIRSGASTYTRSAVTLERLEYCILLNENGEKRFVPGPAVVFPEPTEEFLERDGQTKFRAYELTEHTGLYLKVVAPYEEKGVAHHPGEELFVTGAENPIYFPRQEHAIVKYGGQSMHHAIVVSEGEARYVLNKETGAVNLILGPRMFLPDPRKEVIVRRVLSQETISLLYPGNTEAALVNKALEEKFSNQSLKLEKSLSPKLTRHSRSAERNFTKGAVIPDSALAAVAAAACSGPAFATATGTSYSANIANAINPHGITLENISAAYSEASDFAGEGFERENITSDAPAITLANKYNGAVTVSVWPGYAVQTIRKNGACRTIVGPATTMLEYDEDVRTLALSIGIPKDHIKTRKIAYLRLKNNRIGDIVEAETADGVKVKLAVNYWIDFVKQKDGDEQTWFLTENYVQAVCNEMRASIKNVCRQLDAQSFCESIQDVLQQAIFSEKPSMMLLPEINASLTQLDVVQANIEEPEIAKCVHLAKTDLIKKKFETSLNQAKYDTMLQLASIERGMERIREETAAALHAAKLAQLAREKEEAETKLAQQQDQKVKNVLAEIKVKELEKTANDWTLSLEKAKVDLNLTYREADLQLRNRELIQQTDCWAQRMASVSPSLVASINQLAQSEFMGRISENMAPMAILENKTIIGALKGLLDKTIYEKQIDEIVGVVEAPKS